ncbi:hypothetical protein JL720_398 [Aureococcus anophagefferens]|nr:hypothetical protein JL720_398 [Aureococcus anophagefferens]
MDKGELAGLPAATDLILCLQRCKQLEAAMKERQAGGGAKSGRYMKHDTARLRCLERAVYPELRMGILPTAVNAKMLFDMPAPRDIAGPAKKEMDVWSNVYGWDPRQKKGDAPELDTAGQTTLLLHTTYELERERGGANVTGHTLDYVLKHSNYYIAWMLDALRYSAPFVWEFPRDELTFLALLELEQNRCAFVLVERGEATDVIVKIPARAWSEFEAGMLGDANDPDALAAFEKLEAMDRTGNTVGAETVEFFNQTMSAMRSGAMPPIAGWNNYTIYPPHFSKVRPFHPNNAKTLPLVFWSPGEFWADVGVKCPRLVKDGFGKNFGLCAARLYCPTCGQERETAKAALVTARGQGATDAELEALEKTVASATCWSSTIDPSVMSFMVQRFPFLAMEFPAFVSHRSAVSKDTLHDMLRAARTAQGAHDIESKYDELLAIKATEMQLSVISYQATAMAHQKRTVMPRVDLQTWQHLKMTVPKISDTYVAATTRSYVEAHEPYMLSWLEQNVKRGEFGFGDHSGKHGSRMKLQGDSVLGWTWTEFNEIGQKVISVRVQTTGWNDPSLVAAYDSRQRAEQRLGRRNPLRRLCLDNPKKDGSGAIANVFLGQELNVLRFPGRVVLVRTELECDDACAALATEEVLGFDTENVTYVPPYYGTNIAKAAIVQLCSGDAAFIFVVHAWERAYPSFVALMANGDVEKVAVNVAYDLRMLHGRFNIDINGAVELSSRVKAAHPGLQSYGLASMAKDVLSLHLDKRVQHHLWQQQRYTPRQIMYAANDAWACLRLARTLLPVAPRREGRSTRAAAAARRRFADLSTEVLTGPNLERIAAEATETDDVVELDETRVACTRHKTRSGAQARADSESDDDDDDLGVDEEDVAAAGALDAAEARARTDAAGADDGGLEAPEAVFDAAKRRVQEYAESRRQDDMELPSSLSSSAATSTGSRRASGSSTAPSACPAIGDS